MNLSMSSLVRSIYFAFLLQIAHIYNSRNEKIHPLHLSVYQTKPSIPSFDVTVALQTVVYNKIDSISIEQLDKIARQPNTAVVSCEMGLKCAFLRNQLRSSPSSLSFLSIQTVLISSLSVFGTSSASSRYTPRNAEHTRIWQIRSV